MDIYTTSYIISLHWLCGKHAAKCPVCHSVSKQKGLRQTLT